MSSNTLSREYTDLVTSTAMIVHKEEPLPDNIFDGSPLYDWLNGSGQVKRVEGGERIEIPLENAINPTRGFFSPNDTVNTSAHSPITSVFEDWKYGAVSVRYSQDELDRNRGKEKLYDLVKVRTMNAKKSQIDLLNQRFFQDGTGDAGNAPNGFEKLIPRSNSTISLHGVDPSTNTWWRNVSRDLAVSTGAEIAIALQDVSIEVARGRKSAEPTFFMTTPALYKLYGDGFASLERVNVDMQRGPDAVASRRFRRYAFAGTPIEYDFDCPSGNIYTVNVGSLFLYVLSGSELTPTELVKPSNQLALVGQMLWTGNLVTSNRRNLGVVY